MGTGMMSSFMNSSMIHRSSRLMAVAALAWVCSAFVAPLRAQAMAADALTKARSNCLASVAKVVGLPSSRLKVIRQTSDASGSSVDVKVPNATAPWGCLTNLQGKVEDVSFKGSEGAL
jgi:hypothetical protein